MLETPIMRLRQIAFAAAELDAVVAALGATLDIEVAYRDPGVALFGLRNAVLPVGDAFLEVVSPVEAETAAERYRARRGGDCGYMVMVQVDDTDAVRARAAALGVRVVWSIDLDDIRGTHFHPRDLGGALLSVDTPVPADEWRWAGPAWRDHVHTGRVRGLAAADIACADPAATAARWAALLARPVEARGATHVLALERGVLRFVPGVAPGTEGVVAIDVIATRPAAPVTICGTTIRFVAAD